MSLFDDIVGKAQKVPDLLKLVPAVCGALVLVRDEYRQNPLLFALGLLLVLGSAVWLLFRRVIRRMKPPEPYVALPEDVSGSYIRGLLPFERTDHLLGRDEERLHMITILNATDFRFGYISGDAGVGKTSFVRSVLLREVEKVGMVPVYIKSISGNPLVALNQAFLQAADEGDADLGLSQNRERYQKRQGGKPLCIIIDQFEEFFTVYKSAEERRRIIRDMLLALDFAKGRMKLLVCLRREFVDGLREFAPEVPQPMDIRYSLDLKNWDMALARKVLDKIAESEKLRFSEQLRAELVGDLALGGYVRPVEFQIVAQSLKNAGTYDLRAYGAKGRAEGILAAYIRELIHPSDLRLSELEIRVTRIVLRLFCDDGNNTKRGVGLTYGELFTGVKNTLADDEKNGPVPDERELRDVLAHVVQKLYDRFILKNEDGERINLLHDYIVEPIRMATSDIDTAEKRANRLLGRYLEDRKTGRNAVISRKEYRFIRNNASPEMQAKENARQLFKKSRKKIAWTYGWPVLLVLVVFTVVYRPRYREHITWVYKTDTNITWRCSADDHIMVGITADSVMVWHNGPSPVPVGTIYGGLNTRLSPNGKWLFVENYDSAGIYGISDSGLTTKAIIRDTRGAPANLYNDVPNEGFIGKKDLFYLVTDKGDLYLLDLNQETNHPKPLMNLRSGPLYMPDVNVVDDSPAANYLVVNRMKSMSPLDETGTLPSLWKQDIFCYRDRVADVTPTCLFRDVPPGYWVGWDSRDSLMVHGTDSAVFLDTFKGEEMDREQPPTPKLSVGDSIRFEIESATFSPDGKWLLMVSVENDVYGISTADRAVYKLTEKRKMLGERFMRIPVFNFSGNGKYCSFVTKENDVYLIDLDKINRNNVPFAPIRENEDKTWRNSHICLKYNSDNTQAVLVDQLGKLYTFDLGATPDKTKVLASYDNVHHRVDVLWSRTEKDFVYTFSYNRLYYGKTGEALHPIGLELDTDIQNVIVSADGEKLWVLTSKGIVQVQQKQYLWKFLVLHTQTWPDIYRDSNDGALTPAGY